MRTGEPLEVWKRNYNSRVFYAISMVLWTVRDGQDVLEKIPEKKP
jgi:hypothetical protein